ncbi:sensor histidine kinase [Aestuariibaculum marinum]|uniref:Histidine kinase n=1 Tax=Aestuariibaculum marinum TaxID=2683592 RepID=A0A8J6PZS7_9FLAO|nr:histidine kinase [Aestuariibaculum marinum]MBD0825061.1 histidine kinase [Aestuariibaculum marinum]
MKKRIFSLILFFVIIGAISYLIVSQPKYDYRTENYPSLTKDDNWEYIKDRLFDGETPVVYKLNGPILLKLENATSNDSLLVERAMDEIKGILPDKTIDFYERFIGMSSIELDEYLRSKRPQGVIGIDKDVYKGYKYKDIINSTIYLSFYSNDERINFGRIPGYEYYSIHKNSSIQSKGPNRIGDQFYGPTQIQFLIKDGILADSFKQELIRAHLMSALCEIQGNRRGVEQLPSVYGSTQEGLLSSKITAKDTFLLQKLYAPDFKQQFKAYMYKTYPKNYANQFLNKEQAKIQTIWVCFLLGVCFIFIGFNLSYKFIYKWGYLNYFIPVCILVIGCYNLLVVYLYTLKPENEVENHLIEAYSQVFLYVVFISILLWVFDRYVFRQERNFLSEIILKTLFTAFVFVIPFVFLGMEIFTYHFSIFVFFPVVIVSLGRGLLIYLNHFSENLVKQKDLELTKLRELNANAQVKLLHSQINPHFLYNALNSIAGLATVDGEKTEHMALALSDLFKYTINRKGEKFSTIKDELEMVNNYLEVEQIRFGERLQFNIECDESIQDVEIPRFLIQPLIENAVKHGASKVQDKASIGLFIKQINHQIIIKVTDNGPEFPDGLVSGHGLQSVYDLLELSYGNQAQLSWSNTPEKQICISINQKD